MKPSLQAFIAFIAQLKNQANAQLAKLPPIEQFAANAELQYAFRGLTSLANDLSQFADSIVAKVGDLDVNVTAEVRAALLAAGELVEKTAHDAAVTAAANTREEAVRKEVAATAQKAAVIVGRRAELVSKKLLPAVAAERVPDDLLAGDNYLANCTLIGGRLEKLKPFGLTADNAAPVVAEIAAIGLDEEGVKTFDSRFKLIESSCSATRKAPAAPFNPLLVPPGGAGASAEARPAGVRKLI